MCVATESEVWARNVHITPTEPFFTSSLLAWLIDGYETQKNGFLAVYINDN